MAKATDSKVVEHTAELLSAAPPDSAQSPALWATQDEIDHRTCGDWWAAHTSFMLPLHAWRGTVMLGDAADNELLGGGAAYKPATEAADPVLTLVGVNKNTKEQRSWHFTREQVKDIHLGFDEHFRRCDDRGLGLTFSPLRITLDTSMPPQQGKPQQQLLVLYLIIGFKRITRCSSNPTWCNLLRSWASAS